MKSLYVITCILAIIACKNTSTLNSSKEEKKSKNLTYLALGDSYTIGEMVKPTESFPAQLVNRINSTTSFTFNVPTIIAKTGWRSDELIEASKAVKTTYDLVSVLIGVNNQYQGHSITQFEEDFRIIVNKAIASSKKGAQGVFVYSIPDYSVMPFMKGKNIKKVASELKNFNITCKTVANELGVSFYNITPISQKAAFDSNLVANDKLHPSSKMYKIWINETLSSIISNQLK